MKSDAFGSLSHVRGIPSPDRIQCLLYLIEILFHKLAKKLAAESLETRLSFWETVSRLVSAPSGERADADAQPEGDSRSAINLNLNLNNSTYN